MAFQKRTWLARIGIGLNKFIIGEPDENGKQTITNAPDTITQQGDVISASNLNDLENRIADAFDEKQDTLNIVSQAIQNSTDPITSGGVYNLTIPVSLWEIPQAQRLTPQTVGMKVTVDRKNQYWVRIYNISSDGLSSSAGILFPIIFSGETFAYSFCDISEQNTAPIVVGITVSLNIDTTKVDFEITWKSSTTRFGNMGEIIGL